MAVHFYNKLFCIADAISRQMRAIDVPSLNKLNKHNNQPVNNMCRLIIVSGHAKIFAGVLDIFSVLFLLGQDSME
jgi:hypothetical protein